ncbi:MAG TPA: RNA methyltransferase [Candidatus Nanopelagicales bacterium]
MPDTARGLGVLTARSARVRDARALTVAKFRRARGELLAEGPQAAGAALAAGVVTALFVDAAAQERRVAEVVRAAAIGVPVHVVAPEGFAGLVSAQTPQGVVAVCRWQPATWAQLIGQPGPGQLVLAHEMADPGNAGAVIRVADAAGAQGVALSERSVDPTNAKCVRASAGSLFHLPVVAAGGTPEAIAALRAAGHRVLAADVRLDAVDLFDAERRGLLDGRVTWVLGNEAHGLPDAVLEVVDHVVRIPILGRAESLNLATAAAVCLYAYARAHR